MLKFWKEWKGTILAGILIFILGFGLRLYHLNLLPIFGDEAIYIRWAQIMRADPALRFVPLSDGKQPLQMWSMIPFLKIFTDPLFAGRLLSVLTGLGSLVGIFVLTYLLFKNKKVGLIASLTYAVSPYSVFFDRLALADSMLAFFGVWTGVFGILMAKTKRLDFAMLLGFSLGGALLTKSPAIFFILLVPLTWILGDWPKEAKGILYSLLKIGILYSVSLLIAYAMFNVLRLGTNFHMIALRNKDYVYPLNHIFERPFDPFLPFLTRALEWLWTLGPWVLIFLGIIGILISFKKSPKEILILTVWFILPILVQAEFAQTFTARYIFFSLPYLCILAASSFFAGSENWKKLTTIGTLLLIFLALRTDYFLLDSPEYASLPRSERSGYLEDWTSGVGIKEVGEYIRSEYLREPTKKIVVGTEGYFGTLPDGLQIYLNDIREIVVIGVGIDLKDVPKSLSDSVKAGNKTYLVINSTRFFGEPLKLGLNLLAVYPKAVKPDGSRETLLFYQLVPEAPMNDGLKI